MSLPRRHNSKALEARIQELLALQPQTTAEPTTAPQIHEECHLLKLPAELRKTIYELVVWHAETDGIISPVPAEPAPLLRPYMTVFATHEDWELNDNFHAQRKEILPQLDSKKQGVRALLRNGLLPPTQRIEVQVDGQTAKIDFEAWRLEKTNNDLEKSHLGHLLGNERQRLVRNYKSSTAGKHEHVCKLDCLTNPPLTLVNRQIREESLAVFYEVNHFHFEMGNFIIRRGDKGVRIRGNPSPIDWWRAVGDTDLRSIAKLSLVGHPLFGNHEDVATANVTNAKRGVMLWYNKLEESVKVENKESEYLRGYLKEEMWDGLPAIKKDPQAGLSDLLPHLQQEGCSVRALEGILDRLEPKRGDYLIDHSVACPTPAVPYQGIEHMAWVPK